jgi:predicted nucleic acid-binding protein
MAVITALFDACVLYPAPLRDLLMRLATTGLFRARWSEAIHDEWIGAVLEQRPELRTQLARTRQLMDAHVLDCLITDYDSLIDTLVLPDPDDRHVLAAAIMGRANIIVTKNLKDFPADRLAPFRISAQHPDLFVRYVLGLDETVMVGAVARHRASLRHPPKTPDAYLDTLLVQELPETVAFLRQRLGRI